MSKSGVCPYCTHWTQAGGRFSHRLGKLPDSVAEPALQGAVMQWWETVQTPTELLQCHAGSTLLTHRLWFLQHSAGTLDLHFEASSLGHLLFLTQTTFWEKQMGWGAFWSLCLLPFKKVLHPLSPLISACDHSECSALRRKEASLSGFHQEDSYVFNHWQMEKTLCSFHMNYFVHFIGSARVWINITSLKHCGACSINNGYILLNFTSL